MAEFIFPTLGAQLKSARAIAGFTQPQLAARLGRDRARISELERDLTNGRLGRDRLTLFAEMCDALGIVPVLVPRNKVSAVHDSLEVRDAMSSGPAPPKPVFDDLFVALDDSDD